MRSNTSNSNISDHLIFTQIEEPVKDENILISLEAKTL
jgi:hypothetical protein